MKKVNVHEAKTHLSRPIEGGFAAGKLVVHGEVTDPLPDSWLDEMEKEGGI